jgi:hypothetical protein
VQLRLYKYLVLDLCLKIEAFVSLLIQVALQRLDLPLERLDPFPRLSLLRLGLNQPRLQIRDLLLLPLHHVPLVSAVSLFILLFLEVPEGTLQVGLLFVF